MKSGSRDEGRAAVVGFESSQWQSMIRRRRLLGQALTRLNATFEPPGPRKMRWS